jgi:murein DD-endopeptidase MepM/ murein hydrolase activator NlpD
MIVAAAPVMPAQTVTPPEIAVLGPEDPLFVQQQADIRDYYRARGTGNALPQLVLYSYAPDTNETLFGIAARLSVPYSAVATLNGMSNSSLEGYEQILLPNIPGVFVPLAPVSDLEYVMQDLRADFVSTVVMIPSAEGPKPFRFFPGDDFLPDERRSFLGLLFRHPLPDGIVSSPYGLRTNPISGLPTFHYGADFSAPEGTPVRAARGGVVTSVDRGPVLGLSVTIVHTGGFETIYGHLSSASVTLNQEVSSGMILGQVGSTGLTTGSHLHFEIRQNGRHRDPLPLLPGGP